MVILFKILNLFLEYACSRINYRIIFTIPRKIELLCGTMQSCLLISCKTILLHYKRKEQLLTIVLGSLMELSVPSAVHERNQRILYATDRTYNIGPRGEAGDKRKYNMTTLFDGTGKVGINIHPLIDITAPFKMQKYSKSLVLTLQVWVTNR